MEDALRPIAMFIILDYIWNLIRKVLKRRIMVVDEAWYMMRYGDSAGFMYSIAKRARKYYLGLTTITQDVEDFLSTDYGKAIVTNSSIQILLKQSTAAIDRLTQVFYLSEGEQHLLLSADVGQGLFFAGSSHVAVRVIASPEEYSLVTTKPQDVNVRPGSTSQNPQSGGEGGLAKATPQPIEPSSKPTPSQSESVPASEVPQSSNDAPIDTPEPSLNEEGSSTPVEPPSPPLESPPSVPVNPPVEPPASSIIPPSQSAPSVSPPPDDSGSDDSSPPSSTVPPASGETYIGPASASSTAPFSASPSPYTSAPSVPAPPSSPPPSTGGMPGGNLPNMGGGMPHFSSSSSSKSSDQQVDPEKGMHQLSNLDLKKINERINDPVAARDPQFQQILKKVISDVPRGGNLHQDVKKQVKKLAEDEITSRYHSGAWTESTVPHHILPTKEIIRTWSDKDLQQAINSAENERFTSTGKSVSQAGMKQALLQYHKDKRISKGEWTLTDRDAR